MARWEQHQAEKTAAAEAAKLEAEAAAERKAAERAAEKANARDVRRIAASMEQALSRWDQDNESPTRVYGINETSEGYTQRKEREAMLEPIYRWIVAVTPLVFGDEPAQQDGTAE